MIGNVVVGVACARFAVLRFVAETFGDVLADAFDATRQPNKRTK
jgi:hypothetical protein